MKRAWNDRGEDYRWNFDRPVTAADFNTINDVGIFAGPIGSMYPVLEKEGLKALLEAGEITLLDVRDGRSYEEAHICGAVNLPVDDVERDAHEKAGRGSRIVVYGAEPGSMEAAVAADKLKTIGYEMIALYAGGMLEWGLVGLCVEGKEAAGQSNDRPEPSYMHSGPALFCPGFIE